MAFITRSAMLQARVYPEVKYASEKILWRIGLSMSEAMELFLRRVIVDEKLPFEIIALEDATIEKISDDWKRLEGRTDKHSRSERTSRPPR